MFISLLIMELVSRILQAMIETITRSTVGNLRIKYLFQLTGSDLGCSGRKDNTFTFLDIYLKIPRHVEIFIKIVSTFLLFRILDSPIPVRLKNKFTFLIQLHKQLRITGIHTSLDTILYNLIIAARLRVLMRIFTHTAESQKRSETQGGSRMRVKQCITNQNSILMVYKDFFFS